MRDQADYEYFVCYAEKTARDYAQAIYDCFKDRGYTVYVNHVFRERASGKFRPDIDLLINKCMVFILLNTYDSLSRTEVIREDKVAFPNGNMNNHDFWIFRERRGDDAGRGDENFKSETNIDLSEFYQNDFENTSSLARQILRKCDGRKKRSRLLM
jgi:hypothetical protein